MIGWRVTRIEDPDDARVADYRHVKERDLVGRRGRFIAEGEVVLRMLLTSSLVAPLSILIDERRLANLESLLAVVPATTPIYAAAQAVIDAIAGFHLHRGILAVGERVAPPAATALLDGLPQEALVVVAMGVGNHDNIGGLFRNAAAFGADAVLVDAGCCDPLYRKAIRVSVGGVLVSPWARLERGEDAVDLLRAKDFEVLSLSPAGEIAIDDLAFARRTAFLFGAEGPGLAGEVLARTTSVRIPIRAGFDSLNVATTSGIVLQRLSRGRLA